MTTKTMDRFLGRSFKKCVKVLVVVVAVIGRVVDIFVVVVGGTVVFIFVVVGRVVVVVDDVFDVG